VSDLPIDPDDFDELASILARGYLRHRETRRRQLSDSLATPSETSPDVRVVNTAENREIASASQGDAE
jgi:hypothetical protein